MSARPRLRALPGGASQPDPPRLRALPGRGSQPDPPRLRALPGGASQPDPPRLRALPGRGAHGPRARLAGVLAAAGSFLLEPAAPRPEALPPAPPGLRRVIAVFGLGRGCGVTVVSRALAVELASRDPDGAAAVHCEVRGGGIPLATPPATRLARVLADVPGADTRAVGRLCLVAGADRAAVADTARHHAPLVLDAGSTFLGGAPAAIADQAVVVATPATEPALAAVAAECLGRLGHEPIVVLNRSSAADVPDSAQHGASAWSTRSVLRLPDSRMGAQLALGGREPRGELARAIAELADMCEGPR